MTPEGASCPWCGEPDSGAATCSRCGGDLLIDITIDPIADERVKFSVARALSALGSSLGSFGEVKAALETAEQCVVRGAPRVLLAQVNQALVPFGLVGHAVVRRGEKRRGAGLALGVACVLALAFAGVAVIRFARTPQVVVVPLGVPGASVAPAAVAPYDKKNVLAAVVQLSCGGQLGSGFFVDSDRVLTNAHVVCGNGLPLRVLLSDGRALLGKIIKRDDWLDYALVDVGGAGVNPLRLGDSTLMSAGDPVALVGSPQGVSFTWREGRVSAVARNHLGIAYLQIDASVNPGNSGGPLVNAAGEAVGIVSMKVTSADGVGLALPVEYVEPPEGDRLDRWNVQLASVAKEDEHAVAEAAENMSRPILMEAAVGRDGVEARIVMKGHGEPLVERIDVQLQRGDEILCRDQAVVQRWIPMEQTLHAEQSKLQQNRELQWVMRSGTLKDVQGAIAVASFDGCDFDGLDQDPVLVLPGGAQGQDRLQLPLEELKALHRARPGNDVRVPAPPASAPSGATPKVADLQAADHWRASFAKADVRIAQAQQYRDAAQGWVDNGGPQWLLERNRHRLKEAEANLHQAVEAKADLEKKAAEQSIPLEWRR